MTRSPATAPETAAAPALADRERAVIDALRDIEFGTIEVAIHNARIVQITRSQKFRFDEG
ncbi:MAG: YezD family protein [Xanthomonadales bacterium]|nr:YezD family protein [Xanthomonadales bacterium]